MAGMISGFEVEKCLKHDTVFSVTKGCAECKKEEMKVTMEFKDDHIVTTRDKYTQETIDVLTALDKQEGGSHYKDWPIQPVEFIVANNIPYREANVIKYVVRHKFKNGAEDIKKAIHYLQMVLEDYA